VSFLSEVWHSRFLEGLMGSAMVIPSAGRVYDKVFWMQWRIYSEEVRAQ
jgi:hypothetical protein